MPKSSTRGQSSRVFMVVGDLQDTMLTMCQEHAFFFVFLFLQAPFMNLTIPGRRLVRPCAALLKAEDKPKPDASRLCISASPGPPCPLACR